MCTTVAAAVVLLCAYIINAKADCVSAEKIPIYCSLLWLLFELHCVKRSFMMFRTDYIVDFICSHFHFRQQ